MAKRQYAQDTTVSVAKTRAELEDLLSRHGATSTAVFQSTDNAAIAFEMHGRRILFRLRLPDANAREFTHATYGARGEQKRTADDARKAHEKACRRLWRALLLAVKAKLVSVDDGVESFEEAFMAHVVMPDGRTVAEHTAPRIQQAYDTGEVPKLLPAPDSKG